MYDIIIIGAGPAGLTAALYGGRQGSKVLVIDKDAPGGQAATTNLIENYPGTDKDKTGPQIMARMLEQAKEFGAEIIQDTIEDVILDKEVKSIITKTTTYEAKAVIIATGAAPRRLGVPGEDIFTGKGVGYCATCDAPFFEGLHVYVIGGGNSAVDEADYLTKFAKKVTLIHRRDKLSADQVSIDKLMKNDKVDFIWNSEVVSFEGQGLLKKMTIRDRLSGETREIVADEGDMAFGVFVFVGLVPSTELFQEKLKLDQGYIVTDEDMRTEVKNIYAVGDVRKKSLRQVVTATADGAIAAHTAMKDLE